MGSADTHYTTSPADTFIKKQMNEGWLAIGAVFPPWHLTHQPFIEKSLFPSLDILSYRPWSLEFLVIKSGLIGWDQSPPHSADSFCH